MNSSDIFDTLIGRWYYYPDSIFKELEYESGFDNFTWLRKHAEATAVDKTFDGIYETFQSLTGCTNEKLAYLKEAEFSLEKERTFPIPENIAKTAKDTVLISDTYFNESRISELLTHNGIVNFEKIICSYDGKSSGRVWNTIRPDMHTGDNLKSDIEIPGNCGIFTDFFDASLSPNEKWLEIHSFPKLAYLCRAVRLSNPYQHGDVRRDLWNEQADVNLPILIILSNYLDTVYLNNKLLFTYRDCCNLFPIFTAMYPGKNAEPFYTSRLFYTNPTEQFDIYSKDMYIEDSVIIDLQGTGNTCFNYFKSPKYFTLVNSDLDRKNPIDFLFHRSDGYTDKIERLNYYEFSYSGIKNNGNSWEPDGLTFSNNYDLVLSQRAAIEKAVGFIQKGFSLEGHYDLSILKDFMNYMENHCVVCKCINHEEM